MTHLRDDCRFALRLLRKSPLVSVVSALSLALGIGGTTAVFSLMDALLLHPLPAVGSLDGLVKVEGARAKAPEKAAALSFADYEEYAGQRGVMRGIAAMAGCDLSLSGRGPAERLAGLAVAGDYFTLLRLAPVHGRLLARGDETAPVAVLGYDLWRRRFGGDPGVISSTMILNGRSVTVVGIAPRGFAGTDLAERREIWLPLGAYPGIVAGVMAPFSGKHDRSQEWLNVIGRLAPGTSLTQARTVFGLVARRLAAAYPATNAQRGVRIVPLAEVALGSNRSRPLVAGFAARLMAVVAVVLGVAALNVAGLLLARALARRREIAIRLSLGAGRGRLLQQLLVEGLVLAFVGAVAGIALAQGGVTLLERLELPVSVAVRDLALSGRALVFALLVSCAVCVLFAFVPALQAARTEVVPALRGERRRGRRPRAGLQELLVSLQIAAAFLILGAAGLLLRTLAGLDAIAPGFDPSHVLAATIDLAPAGYQGQRVSAFYADLLERLRRLPGVVDASMVSALPVMGGDVEVMLSVSPAGRPAPAGPAAADSSRGLRHVLVGSRFFQTAGMRLLRGRDFGREDGAGAAGAVILNESAARILWPGEDPLGRQLRLTQTAAPFSVVGLVSDATYASLKEERQPVLYLAHAQSGQSFIGPILAPQMTLLVRAAGDPRRQLAAVREQVRAVDPRLPVFGSATLEDLLGATVRVERQAAELYGGLALVAVALAMLGLFGVMTRSIVERTREIGIRAACGATPQDVRRHVLGRSAVLTLCGLAAGVAAGIPAARLVASQLYGVSAYDPASWLLTAVAIVALALLASAAPAARAAAIDPVRAMRSE